MPPPDTPTLREPSAAKPALRPAPAAAPAADPTPFGNPCTPQLGVRFCPAADLTQRVPSWDKVPMDVDVTLPATGDGPFPTIVMMHGYGGNKGAYEAKAASTGFNNVGLAARGYAVVTLSARAGRGLDQLHEAVFKTYALWNKRVSTPDLNRWLGEAVQRHAPPASKGRRVKLRFMTQPSSRPPTFVAFCSRPGELPGSYIRYLTNSLRQVFALPGLGSQLLSAVSQRDLMIVQGIVMFLAASVLLINFLVDLSYAWIDPRPAAQIVLHTDVSVSTVHNVISRYNRFGPEAIEGREKGIRRRCHLSKDEEAQFLEPFLDHIVIHANHRTYLCHRE